MKQIIIFAFCLLSINIFSQDTIKITGFVFVDEVEVIKFKMEETVETVFLLHYKGVDTNIYLVEEDKWEDEPKSYKVWLDTTIIGYLWEQPNTDVFLFEP